MPNSNTVASNNGLDWGNFATTAQLPNASGATIQTGDVQVGARAFVIGSGYYYCTTATEGAAVWGTLARSVLGTGTEVAAASQTDNVININGAASIPMVRAGSITGFRVTLSGAPTVANIAVSIYKNGSIVAATTLTFVPAAAATQVVTINAGSSTYLATDVLSLGYTSGAIGNTPTITATIEITD
jgi:hypothetical protein